MAWGCARFCDFGSLSQFGSFPVPKAAPNRAPNRFKTDHRPHVRSLLFGPSARSAETSSEQLLWGSLALEAIGGFCGQVLATGSWGMSWNVPN